MREFKKWYEIYKNSYSSEVASNNTLKGIFYNKFGKTYYEDPKNTYSKAIALNSVLGREMLKRELEFKKEDDEKIL